MADLEQRREADRRRQRRRKLHVNGDHSECLPERCEVAAGGPDNVTKINPGGRAGGLVAAYRQRLEKVDRLDTPEAWQVIALAEAVERGGHSAAGLATLSRELRAAMKVALEDVEQAGGDRLDGMAGGFGSA